MDIGGPTPAVGVPSSEGSGPEMSTGVPER